MSANINFAAAPLGSESEDLMADNRDGGAKSFRKMALIIDCFSRTRTHLTIAEIAERSGMPRATVHRMVASLRDVGFLDQDGRRHAYRLGLKFFHYGSAVLASLDINRHAKPHILNLHQITGEVVHFYMFDGAQMVCVEREEMGPTRFTTVTTIEAAPIYCTGVGKAFLAFQEEALVRRIADDQGLKRLTDTTITTIEALLQDLSVVRERGYSIDAEENEPGIRCVGAPVRDSHGRVFASVSVSGPSERLPESRLVGLAPAVIRTASQISNSLGWSDSRS